MTTPAPDNIPDPPPHQLLELTFFRPPERPNGGTVYQLPTDTGETR